MRTWLITGCSSGIGRGIAEAALMAGDNVVVTARNTAAIKILWRNIIHTEFGNGLAEVVRLSEISGGSDYPQE